MGKDEDTRKKRGRGRPSKINSVNEEMNSAGEELGLEQEQELTPTRRSARKRRRSSKFHDESPKVRRTKRGKGKGRGKTTAKRNKRKSTLTTRESRRGNQGSIGSSAAVSSSAGPSSLSEEEEQDDTEEDVEAEVEDARATAKTKVNTKKNSRGFERGRGRGKRGRRRGRGRGSIVKASGKRNGRRSSNTGAGRGRTVRGKSSRSSSRSSLKSEKRKGRVKFGTVQKCRTCGLPRKGHNCSGKWELTEEEESDDEESDEEDSDSDDSEEGSEEEDGDGESEDEEEESEADEDEDSEDDSDDEGSDDQESEDDDGNGCDGKGKKTKAREASWQGRGRGRRRNADPRKINRYGLKGKSLQELREIYAACINSTADKVHKSRGRDRLVSDIIYEKDQLHTEPKRHNGRSRGRNSTRNQSDSEKEQRPVASGRDSNAQSDASAGAGNADQNSEKMIGQSKEARRWLVWVGQNIESQTKGTRRRRGRGARRYTKRTARQKVYDDGVAFLNLIQHRSPSLHTSFLELTKSFMLKTISSSQFAAQAKRLFKGHKTFIQKFEQFCPNDEDEEADHDDDSDNENENENENGTDKDHCEQEEGSNDYEDGGESGEEDDKSVSLVASLKDQYRELYRKNPRGLYANSKEWLERKIIEKGGTIKLPSTSEKRVLVDADDTPKTGTKSEFSPGKHNDEGALRGVSREYPPRSLKNIKDIKETKAIKVKELKETITTTAAEKGNGNGKKKDMRMGIEKEKENESEKEQGQEEEMEKSEDDKEEETHEGDHENTNKAGDSLGSNRREGIRDIINNEAMGLLMGQISTRPNNIASSSVLEQQQTIVGSPVLTKQAVNQQIQVDAAVVSPSISTPILYSLNSPASSASPASPGSGSPRRQSRSRSDSLERKSSRRPRKMSARMAFFMKAEKQIQEQKEQTEIRQQLLLEKARKDKAKEEKMRLKKMKQEEAKRERLKQRALAGRETGTRRRRASKGQDERESPPESVETDSSEEQRISYASPNSARGRKGKGKGKAKSNARAAGKGRGGRPKLKIRAQGRSTRKASYDPLSSRAAADNIARLRTSAEILAALEAEKLRKLRLIASQSASGSVNQATAMALAAKVAQRTERYKHSLAAMQQHSSKNINTNISMNDSAAVTKALSMPLEGISDKERLRLAKKSEREMKRKRAILNLKAKAIGSALLSGNKAGLKRAKTLALRINTQRRESFERENVMQMKKRQVGAVYATPSLTLPSTATVDWVARGKQLAYAVNKRRHKLSGHKGRRLVSAIIRLLQTNGPVTVRKLVSMLAFDASEEQITDLLDMLACTPVINKGYLNIPGLQTPQAVYSFGLGTGQLIAPVDITALASTKASAQARLQTIRARIKKIEEAAGLDAEKVLPRPKKRHKGNAYQQGEDEKISVAAADNNMPAQNFRDLVSSLVQEDPTLRTDGFYGLVCKDLNIAPNK